MKENEKYKLDTDKLKAFATNAVTEIYKTEPESKMPISSDRSVEEARDWGNDGSRL
jgi:hypothetical protein